jgi:hypothetical protein
VTSAPLIIHHHIAKTAGTSLSNVIQANCRAGEYVNLDRVVEGEPQQFARDFYAGLPGDRRERIRCIEGLTAQFLIPVVTDRRIQPICLLRDPVDRVISLYLYLRWRHEHLGERDRAARIITLMLEHRWELKDVYLELGSGEVDGMEGRELFGIFFDGQAKEILAAFAYRGDLRAADERREMSRFKERALELLSRRYLVGTQDRFSESVRMFADAFGWSKAFVPARRVNPYRRMASAVDEETRALIRENNPVDAELHAHFSEQLRGHPPVSRASQVRWRVRHQVARGRRRIRRTRA